MKKRSSPVFSTTKNGGFVTERKSSEIQMGRLLGEIGTQKENGEKDSRPEYLQFVLAIIRQPVFLIRILKKKIGISEFSSGKVGATEISRKRRNKKTNYYNQKNLYNFESFLHF